MPKLFRVKIVSYTLPDGSYRTKRGKRVTSKTPGAVKVVTASKKWYGRVNGKPVPLSESKERSQRMYNALVGKAELEPLGIDRFAEHRATPLTEHLKEYEDYLLGVGTTKRYVCEVIKRCRGIIAGCRFRFPQDLDAEAVVNFLADMRKRDLALTTKRKSGRQGFGVRTSNHYLAAIKSFAKWLAAPGKNQRLPYSPIAGIPRLNIAVDVRVDRRVLPPEDFSRFLECARTGPSVRKLTGLDRFVIYATASFTGLRCGEVASLKPEDFSLTGNPATVTTQAYYIGNKKKKPAVLPLHPELAELLRAYLDGKPEGKPIWTGRWRLNGAAMVAVDLQAAGIEPVDAAGRVFDFHSLRHQFLSNLASAGIHPKKAMELARHSDINLTLRHYTHVELHDLAAAVEKLPGLSAPVTAEKAKKA